MYRRTVTVLQPDAMPTVLQFDVVSNGSGTSQISHVIAMPSVVVAHDVRDREVIGSQQPDHVTPLRDGVWWRATRVDECVKHVSQKDDVFGTIRPDARSQFAETLVIRGFVFAQVKIGNDEYH